MRIVIASCGDKSSIIRIIIKPTNYKCVGFGQDFLDDGPREKFSQFIIVFFKKDLIIRAIIYV